MCFKFIWQKYILQLGKGVKLWLKHVKEKLKLNFSMDIALHLLK